MSLAPKLVSRAQGADEHESERTPRCVSDRAQAATRGSAIRFGAEVFAAVR